MVKLAVLACATACTQGLPAPVVIADVARGVAATADGSVVWIEPHATFDFALVQRAPDGTTSVLDHAGFAPEFGSSFVMVGDDGIVWGLRAAFTSCGQMRIATPNGGRTISFPDVAICDAVPLDQRNGTLLFAYATDGGPATGEDGAVAIDRVELATGLRQPMQVTDGTLVATVRGDLEVFVAIHQIAGTYVAAGDRARFNYSQGPLGMAARFAGLTVIGDQPYWVDEGVGHDPVQVLTSGSMPVADLGGVTPLGLVAVGDQLWTAVGSALVHIDPAGGEPISLETAFPEIPLAASGDSLLVSSTAQGDPRLFLQSLSPY